MARKKKITNWEDENKQQAIKESAPKPVDPVPKRKAIKIPLRNWRVTFQFQGKHGGFLDVDAMGARVYLAKMAKQPKNGLIKSVEEIKNDSLLHD